MRDANVVTLYQNKGERGECNDYRAMSLLNIVGKLLAEVMLMNLQVLAERLYEDSCKKNAESRESHFMLPLLT